MLSYQENKDRMQIQMSQSKAIILSPNTRFKIFWNTIVILLVMYIATISTFRIAYYNDDSIFDSQRTNWSHFFNRFDQFIDAVFVMDIIINFISAYERIDGSYEYNWKKIAINYITGFFLIDLVATLPFEALASIFSHDVKGQSTIAGLQNPAQLLRISRL